MSEGKRITFADIKRQMELASEDIETWPTWMRRAAGLDGEGPDYNTLRAENARLKEALQGMLQLVDADVLVRNTANDHAVGWGTQALLIVQALQQANEALQPVRDNHD